MVPELERLIQAHQNIVFLAAQGFRRKAASQIFARWTGSTTKNSSTRPKLMLSHTFYEQHTAEFFDFYRQKLIVHGAKPNAAHLRLAKLEREGKLKAVVTQNIDGLHQAAGSKTVYELHGSTFAQLLHPLRQVLPRQLYRGSRRQGGRCAPLHGLRRHCKTGCGLV